MIDHDAPNLGAAASITDDELTMLALAADIDVPIGEDAIALWEVLGTETESPLPTWYMPAPMGARRLNGWHGRLVRCSAVSVIASFVVITASGLCNTYGQLHF
jgi:hypothetical protein